MKPVALIALLALAGCGETNTSQNPECVVDDNCPGAGESCCQQQCIPAGALCTIDETDASGADTTVADTTLPTETTELDDTMSPADATPDTQVDTAEETTSTDSGLGEDAEVTTSIDTADSDIEPDTTPSTWPFGTDGALVVHVADSPFVIPAGSIKDFASLTVDAGARIVIGPGSAWTFIGVKGDLIVNGDIIASANESELTTSEAIEAQAPDDSGLPLGEVLSYTLMPSGGGGAGGACGGGTANRVPGVANFGNGGGGCGYAYYGNGWGNDQCGGCASGEEATLSGGGDGGYSSCNSRFAAGAGLFGQAGQDATLDASCSGGSGCGMYGGGGGGGGSRGRHGQGLYLKVGGALAGNGTIRAAGQDGGSGGKGVRGWAEGSCPGYALGAGGGGGGGAGGSGGAIVIRHHGALGSLIASHLDTAGGAGGVGGSGGEAPNAGAAGAPGDEGAAGAAPDIQQYSSEDQ